MWPLAMAAAATARKKGVMALATLKMRLKILATWLLSMMPCTLKAKAAPRNTIPITASINGIKRITLMSANAGGNAVKKTTSRKISHT